jgi:hypothetical protein
MGLFSVQTSFSMAQCISRDTHEGMFRGISVKFLENFPALRTLKLSPLGFDTLGTAVHLQFGYKTSSLRETCNYLSLFCIAMREPGPEK